MTFPEASRAGRPSLFFWYFFLANWLGVAAILGSRHRESGLAFAFAACLVFAFRLALGPEGGKVFLFGFGLGACIEWGCFFWIERAALNAPAPLSPAASEHLFPVTFQYLQIWPSTEILLARGGQFDSREALNNELTALHAGAVTSGVVFGVFSLIAWYWFGVRRLFECVIAPVRRRAQSLKQSVWQRRSGRIAVWLVFGSSIAAVVYWTWWHQMGPLPSIICGTLLLALFGVIGCLDARRMESPISANTRW